MEELKSTEALDREILEDAQKKAARLLRNAEQAANASEREWAKKAETDIAELERKHAERVAERRKETLGRLPRDKRRERAERAERLRGAAMADYLAALPRLKLLSLVQKELSARVGALPSTGLVVKAMAFAPGEVEALLSAVLPARSWTLAQSDSASSRSIDPSNPAATALALPSLVVEGARVYVRVGVESAAEELLREQRAELAVALLGEEASND
jgi:V/A-type H+/Na+-transporting ATPase subunit E